MKNLLFFAAVCLLMATACHKSDEEVRNGQVQIVFNHTVNASSLVPDTLMYQNSLGYTYKITDLQYFVSDITLYHDGGKKQTLAGDDGIHYVDIRIPATLEWAPGDEITPGTYDSLSFTFGINEAKNISNRFPNPPERDMAWPDILGGGYHYMKMNMMYREASATTTQPFMFHLGIGQLYSSATPNADSITGYVQDYFTVSLHNSFVVAPDAVCPIRCTMQIEKWLDGPVTFDFTDYPHGIMMYQAGMHEACLNGRYAFSGTTL